jgi:hypothetical protein
MPTIVHVGSDVGLAFPHPLREVLGSDVGPTFPHSVNNVIHMQSQYFKVPPVPPYLINILNIKGSLLLLE